MDAHVIEIVPIRKELFVELYAFLNVLKRTKLPEGSTFEDSYALADALREAAREAKHIDHSDPAQEEEAAGETIVLLDREHPVVFDEVVCEEEGEYRISNEAAKRLDADKIKIIILSYRNLDMRVSYLQGLGEGRGQTGYKILNKEEVSKLGMALSTRIKEEGMHISSGMKAVH